MLMIMMFMSSIDIEECIRSKNGYDYMGNKSTTTKGKTCISGEVCRASGNDPAPWCKTTDQNTYWDTCDISQCSMYWITKIVIVGMLR